MLEDSLKEFGLTAQEVKVYLALLKLGTALVNEVAKEAGTHRTYTYEVLKSLKSKGLASYVVKSGKQYFEVARPEKLLNILKEKQKMIQEAMPQLNGMYKSAIEKPKIELYEGKEGLKTILDDMINEDKEILVYSSTRRLLQLLSFYFPNFINQRVKSKIKTKVITESSKESSELHKKDKQELREIRFLPEGIEPLTSTHIYGNKVAILSLEKEIIGIIIENKNIADTQRIVFDLLWSGARKP